MKPKTIKTESEKNISELEDLKWLEKEDRGYHTRRYKALKWALSIVAKT